MYYNSVCQYCNVSINTQVSGNACYSCSQQRLAGPRRSSPLRSASAPPSISVDKAPLYGRQPRANLVFNAPHSSQGVPWQGRSRAIFFESPAVSLSVITCGRCKKQSSIVGSKPCCWSQQGCQSILCKACWTTLISSGENHACMVCQQW